MVSHVLIVLPLTSTQQETLIFVHLQTQSSETDVFSP